MVGQDVVYFKMLINLIQTLVYIKIEGKHANHKFFKLFLNPWPTTTLKKKNRHTYVCS